MKDYQGSSSLYHHHPTSSAAEAGISDVSSVPSDAASADSVTDDTVAEVSTQYRHGSDDSHDVSLSRSSHDQSVLDVEQSSPDDGADSRQQQVDSNRAAIDLLLWKLTELERLITLGQVRDAHAQETWLTIDTIDDASRKHKRPIKPPILFTCVQVFCTKSWSCVLFGVRNLYKKKLEQVSGTSFW